MEDKRLENIRKIVVGTMLAISGIVLFAMPLIALRWSARPFAGFLLDPNLVVSDSGEVYWAGKQADPPLGHPERLIAINGTPVATQAEFNTFLEGAQIGDQVAFTFEQPLNSVVAPDAGRDARRIVTLPVTRVNSLGMWNQFWLIYLTGVFVWIIAAWVFRMRPDAHAAQIFVLFAAFGSVAAAGLFDLASTHIVLRFWIVGVSLFGGFNVILATMFPQESRILVRYPRAYYWFLLPGLIICIWAQLWLTHPTDPWAYALPWRYAYMFNGVLLIISLGIMAYRGFYAPSPLVRQQGRVIFTAAMFSFAPLIVFLISYPLGISWPWFNSLVYIPPVVLYPLAIGYTIIRYRLMEVNIVMRRGLTYGLLTVVLVLALTSLAAAAQPILEHANPVVLALVVVLFAIGFDPVRHRMQEGLDRYLFRLPTNHPELLRNYNRDLTTAVTIDEVVTMLNEYVRDGAPDAEPFLFLPDETMSTYSRYADSQSPAVAAKSPIIQLLQGESGAIDLTEEKAWPPEWRNHPEQVAELKAAIVVPMTNSRELLGWLALPPKHSQQPFRSAELTYLTAVANQTLIALERANVVSRLEIRISELDLISQFSQHLNFTVVIDDLLELVYINFKKVLDIVDFTVYLLDETTDLLHAVFYVENDQRQPEKEGRGRTVENPLVEYVTTTGQMVSRRDDDGCYFIISPLNAGADTLGAIHTFYRHPDMVLHPRQEQLFNVLASRTAVALDRLNARYKVEQRAKQLEIINEITFSLASTLELGPLLNQIMDKAIQLLEAEAGTLMLMVADTGELEFRVVRGPASEHLLGNRLPMGTGLAGTAAQTGRPVLVNSVQEDARWFNKVDANSDFQTQSSLTVPMLRQGATLGVLQIINKQNGAPFGDQDQNLLMAFAAQAVLALENARLLEQTDRELQQRVTELSMLQQLDRDLNTTLELDTVLNLTLDWALRICEGSAGAILLADEDRLAIRATRGYKRGFNPDSVQKVGQVGGLVGRVFSSGQPHVSSDVQNDPDYIAAAFDTRSQITLPITYKQRVVGVLAIESSQLDAFDDNALETAVRLTDHAAVAITNAILYEQVNAANRAKSEFVSMVSHELKTPMTSMKGYTDLILSGMTGEINEQQRGFMETIAANLKRMNRQIQDLTDISRIETGQLHMEMGPTAFTNVVSETMQIVRGLYDNKKIGLHLELPPDLPLIQADKERMVQVLTNLVSNACKYSPPETNVTVMFRADEMVVSDKSAATLIQAMAGSNGETAVTRAATDASQTPAVPVIVCSVKDQGYGISKTDQERLFTKFFRADDPNIRKATGTGLGLSITKGIIELHGGQIWVESELKQGTTFHFSIPQATEAL